MNVSADPGSQLLVLGGFGIRVGTRAQHHHEQRGWPDLAGNRIVYRNRGTGPVHETLLARLENLTKNYIQIPKPTMIETAEQTKNEPTHIHLPEFYQNQLHQHQKQM